MITEERVMATLAHSNPVPDVEELDLVQAGTASYLATLEQRSSEVTQLETKKKEETPKMRSRRGWLVAAAIFVAVISVAVILNSQGGSDEAPVATDPTPTTVATTELSIVGDWEGAGWLMSFAETGRIDVSSPLGIATGTYEVTGAELSVTTTESTINNDEEFPNCIGEAIFDVSFDDADTMSLSWVDGKCDRSWPGLVTLTKVAFGSS